MPKHFYENIHKATADTPYLDPYMTNLNYMSHFHEEVECIYVVSGCVNLGLELRVFTLSEGDIALIMPGEVHYYASQGANHVYILKFQPMQDGSEAGFSRIRLKNPVISKDNPVYAQCRDVIAVMFSEYSSKARFYRFAVMSGIYGLSALILRNMDYDVLSPEEKRRGNERLAVLQAVMDYIGQNYSQPISLADAAKAAGFSVYYFAHFFKMLTGGGFWDFLCAYRVEKAKQLLQSTDAKIAEIGFDCGFNSIKTFNRVFKKYADCPPATYKKQYMTIKEQPQA